MQGIIHMTGGCCERGPNRHFQVRPRVDHVAGPASAVWSGPSKAESGSGYHAMKQKAQMPNWVEGIVFPTPQTYVLFDSFSCRMYGLGD